MLQHCLFFEAQFNKVGKLDVQGTFLEKMEVRGINTNLYSLASMTNTFSGVCFFPNLGDGWIAPRQKADLADRAWLMSSDWFLNNPELGPPDEQKKRNDEPVEFFNMMRQRGIR